MSVRGSPKHYDSFDNVADALNLFDKMINKSPKPSIVEFNKLLGAIVRAKHYSIVVSIYNQLELSGVSFNVYLLLAVLGLHCSAGFSLVVANRCYSLVVMHELLILVASLVAEHTL